MALNLSTDAQYLTFWATSRPSTRSTYRTRTPRRAIDPTNPSRENAYRAVAHVDSLRQFHFTETNAYSGNNGRAAILNNSNGDNFFYTAGNAGNGANPQPNGVILGAGTQIITPANASESSQNPGPHAVGSFNVTELGYNADKIGKDDNFRGLTVFNNVVYYTKGSGSNGVNTVYFLDTTGTACPNGVGCPLARATLPTSPLAYNINKLQTEGLPSNMCILAGFPEIPNKNCNHHRLSVRDLVRQCHHSLCCRRRRRLYRWNRSLHSRGRANHRRTSEVGIRFLHQHLEPGLHSANRAGSGRALQHPQLSQGQ